MISKFLLFLYLRNKNNKYYFNNNKTFNNKTFNNKIFNNNYIKFDSFYKK
jgi:hypothetical protein